MSRVFIAQVNYVYFCQCKATSDTSHVCLLSWFGVAILGVSGWLGGELVYVRSVALESEGREDETTIRQLCAA